MDLQEDIDSIVSAVIIEEMPWLKKIGGKPDELVNPDNLPSAAKYINKYMRLGFEKCLELQKQKPRYQDQDTIMAEVHEVISKAILSIPSGQLRNDLTDLNIKVLYHLTESKTIQ